MKQYQEFLREKDCRGRPQGRNYVPFLESKDHSIGTGSSVPGIKCQRVHEYLSDLESSVHYLLEMNDEVIDFREQYPFHDDEIVRNYWEIHGELPSMQFFPSYDLVVTYADRITHEISYVAVSCKPDEELLKESVRARHSRDKEDCARWGFGWQVVTPRGIAECASRRRTCMEICRLINRQDVYLREEEAESFATELLARRRLSTMRREIEGMAHAWNIDLLAAETLFGLALFHGFVRIDLNRHWDWDRPLWPK